MKKMLKWIWKWSPAGSITGLFIYSYLMYTAYKDISEKNVFTLSVFAVGVVVGTVITILFTYFTLRVFDKLGEFFGGIFEKR